jgi:2-keto-4-pentenoate hydratase/2-oxohepta-3-ene-1,7-dioic acid hydratase in catechol pathway
MDKIICVGKNYDDHARELGDAVPEFPVLFLKPPSTLITTTGNELNIPYLEDRGQLHYECEVVVRLRAGGYGLSREAAARAIGEATIGLDMTLRETQARLKKAGHPWELGKVFPGAAIVGPWIPVERVPAAWKEEFTFTVDGERRQRGLVADMRLPIIDCIEYASRHFELCAGDLLFTGTPAGVGPIHRGQSGVLRWGSVSYVVKWT